MILSFLRWIRNPQKWDSGLLWLTTTLVMIIYKIQELPWELYSLSSVSF